MKTRNTNLFTLAALLLAPACKNDPQPAPTAVTQSAQPSPAAPAATAPIAASAPIAHGTPPMAAQTAPRTLEKRADGRAVLGPFSLIVPKDWTETPSTSAMRAAQYQIPAPAGSEAEVIVYYFGEGGAGGVQANIDRWVNQFKQPDGKPSASVAKIEKASFAGQEATVVSLSGRYVAPPMPGGEPVDKPDQALVAVIVPSPKGPYYFRLVGAKATVAKEEAALREALKSLKLE